MLAECNPTPTIGVKDLKVAREFYGKTLGLKPIGESDEEVQLYQSGNGVIEVYHSDFAGTNRATAMTWGVGEKIEEEVAALRSKGVEFEHYTIPDMKLEGDVHVAGDFKVAWFKDPDGNILCLHNY